MDEPAENASRAIRTALIAKWTKRAFRSIGKAAQDKFGELAVAILLLAAAVVWYRIQIVGKKFENISEERAWEIARARVGNNAMSVLPFRNVGMKEQLVAVVVKSTPEERRWPHPGFAEHRIILIHLFKPAGYRIDETKIGLYSWTKDQAFGKPAASVGIVDLDGKGCSFLFAIDWSGGSGMQTGMARLYDPCTEKLYTLDATPDYQTSELELDTSENLRDKPDYMKWMTEKARQTLSPRAVPSLADGEAEKWRSKNGADFSVGTVELTEYRGTVPDTRTPDCLIDDGEAVWTSYFKGAVYRYDKSKRTHTLIYIPLSQYDWVQALTVGKQFVWFADLPELGTTGYRVMAFNKQTHEFARIATGTPDLRSELVGAKACPDRDDTGGP